MADLPPAPADDDKRDALLAAARDLFLKNTYANISIRKIADKARVNSAMIAYYFGSKSGLFREMIKSYIEGNIERAMASIGHVDRMTLREFIANFYKTVPPELLHLALRTILFERGEMRDWLLENLITPAFNTALTIAEEVIDHKGEPIDPIMLRTTLQGMLLAPKLLQPLLTELHPEHITPEFYDSLAGFQADLIASYFDLEKT